ncbi:hypothetical protein [Granulicella tundricola]|uniref:Uncharacterized protein n=1 Tax=Granulicella tundricola (strain ATCC BAA-1859 / DSM 23138 / MP5ACTX9) TaxID=1198114 RepID=E8X6H8_GRATM|nr:hypothetical protein [Granulicella tundricola]ADW71062.1 hypothetical protein AciX9_4294 [Granulicella tundricola MP5ACTX9]
MRIRSILTVCTLLLASLVNAHGQSILTRDQASAVMPATVFYAGRTASIQGRNSTGLRIAGSPTDHLILAALVDTSGYSSGVQETYQAYLITEVPLHIANQTLPPGAYGIGFIAQDHFVVMDLGAHQLLNVPSTKDATLPRPNPLQLLADPATPGHFRLYAGRNFVSIAPADVAH